MSHSALLEVVREERQLKQQQVQRVLELEQESLEQATSYEVAIESLRKQLADQRRTLRQLERGSDHGFAENFEQYERDIAQLRGEAAQLRNRNMDLEVALAERKTWSVGSASEQSAHTPGRTQRAALPADVKRVVKRLRSEVLQLRSQRDGSTDAARKCCTLQRLLDHARARRDAANRRCTELEV